MGKEATAYLLGEDTIPAIVLKTGIEKEVLESWLVYDLSFGLHSKVIVVEITPDDQEKEGKI